MRACACGSVCVCVHAYAFRILGACVNWSDVGLLPRDGEAALTICIATERWLECGECVGIAFRCLCAMWVPGMQDIRAAPAAYVCPCAQRAGRSFQLPVRRATPSARVPVLHAVTCGRGGRGSAMAYAWGVHADRSEV